MDTILVGDYFTVSKNRRTGDRSYLTNIWECVKINGTQIWALAKAGDFWTEQSRKNEPRCFVKDEHEFVRCGKDGAKIEGRKMHILHYEGTIPAEVYDRLKAQCVENFGAGKFLLLEGGIQYKGMTEEIAA
jgi:hypothetical protein